MLSFVCATIGLLILFIYLTPDCFGARFAVCEKGLWFLMKLLFLKWNSFGSDYVLKAWEKAGFQCIIFDFPQRTEDTRGSEELAAKLATAILEKEIDVVFSLNYFATAAIACKACRRKYISWTYDSPFIQLYSKTIELDTNYAFVFDRAEYLNLKKKGVTTVYYLPMAAPVEIYDSMVPMDLQRKKYNADVAMIGSMYTEKKHQLFRHLENLDSYTRGYLEALMNAQKKLYGVSVLESSLTKDIVENMQKVCPMIARGDGIETIEWVFANYFLARKLTSMERQELIGELSEQFDVAVYTPEPTPQLPKVRNMGYVDYYEQAPYAMKCAKINLNITLRSIVSGIPLRAMDIMGCGGFLMTNYQADFLDFFVPDEDFVYFESPEDLKEKVKYYLEHDEKRRLIAQSGYMKMRQYHTFDHRVQEMCSVAGLM